MPLNASPPLTRAAHPPDTRGRNAKFRRHDPRPTGTNLRYHENVQEFRGTRCHEVARPHKNQQPAPQNRAILLEQCEKSGLGWKTEHFLGFLIVTFIACVAWPRPLIVGLALMAMAGLLEALQGLHQIEVAGRVSHLNILGEIAS
ncbi:hypothetical protein ACVWXO_006427 [Bradyrhizobium sp. LM2.7]